MRGEWHGTYRLQLHAGFPLPAARDTLPYFVRLGISHVYLSPCLQAGPGSTHGYDVTDPRLISEELGGISAWRKFCMTARELNLGILLDFVPNHMAATAHNPWWDDLLRHGPASRYGDYFDIFPYQNGPRWRLHLPSLGVPYHEALEQGQLAVTIQAGLPRVVAGAQTWPLAPASWPMLFTSPTVLNAFERLAAFAPRADWDEPARNAYSAGVAAAESIWAGNLGEGRAQIEALNRDPARLHALLEAQHYALHHWRREGEVVNYRRFFNVSGLVGMRVEDPAVFAASHERLAALAATGEIDGVRVDHPDGLADPGSYFHRLREILPRGRIYAEKILGDDERLRAGWAVNGTVGYDFLAKVNRLWMDGRKADALSGIYADFTSHTVNLPQLVREKKTHVLERHFSPDLDRLTAEVMALAQSSWRTCDLSAGELRRALAALTVELPVYRTYRDGAEADPPDRTVLAQALAAARSQAREVGPPVFDFLGPLLLEKPESSAARFVTHWQQLTPAVAAKGVEDTAFYCYDRLLACNDVGAQPSLLGISAEAFHEFCHHLAEKWPETLLATSTHDTKRSEDVRARICVLTEDVERWSIALREWSALNLPAWRGREPDRHLEYLLYQTLVGAWPLPQERAWAYLLKASREAKIHTSWRTPNAAYELAIRGFLDVLYASAEFQQSLEAFVRPLILPGRINSLAQTLVKLTAPGVPDFYQGCEQWDLSLVDPDNRRPVDFEAHQRALDAIASASAAAVWTGPDEEGRAKQWLIARGLALRREYPECFARGSSYLPIAVRGARLGHVLGFLRGGRMATLVPRFLHTLRGDWGDTLVSLPPGRWKNWLTGAELQDEVSPGRLFRDFPVALLVLQP